MLDCYIAHISKGRIRLKFPSQKGNVDFFNSLLEKLKQQDIALNVKENLITGSVVLEHDKTSEELISSLKNLSILKIKDISDENPQNKIINSINTNIGYINSVMRKITSGAIDLKSAVLLFLIISAIYQIARGNLSAIPWYTAIFYLNSLLSKR
ncbi:MAG: hypothetical protein N3A00_00385 [Thermodesulfovibrio sp.]|nr:hypothetical protein [Thermodesulfovibrio sp.]